MNPKDVFISYKVEDFDEANWVRSTLETNGITWLDGADVHSGRLELCG